MLRDHGFFAWGKDYNKALENAVAFETICMFYFYTKIVTKKKFISKSYHKFHYLRKNGENKFYGEYTFHYWLWKNYLEKNNKKNNSFSENVAKTHPVR